jgi:hypothetical protein
VLYNVENDTTALPLRRIIATFRGWEASFEIHQSTIYYAGLLGRWNKRIVDQASDIPSIIIFFMISCKILCKNPFNLFFYLFKK